MAHDSHHGFHGPKCWILSLIAGLIVGWALTHVITPRYPAEPAGDGGHAAEGDAGAGAEPPAHPQAGDHEPGEGTPAQEPGAPEEGTGERAPGDDAGRAHGEHHYGPEPVIPLILVIPFALLLASIAVMPFIDEQFWHHHFPDFAFFLGALMVAYYITGFDAPGYAPPPDGLSYGVYQMRHTALEYYAFIALVGGLYVSTGGILIRVKGPGRPVVNTGLLAFGSVIANVVGTAGASVLLIRPFMRINKGRLRSMHVVFFIFTVSNCGGCLTPIGDPPLYLGFLKGVPFTWTITHLWPEWATCVGMILAVFFCYDAFMVKEKAVPDDPDSRTGFGVSVSGVSGILALALIIFGVFLDPLLHRAGVSIPSPVPLGPTFQVVVAATAYFVASKENHRANDFNFFPVKEVGLLFLGIFATMTPALGYLAAHGGEMGLNTPTRFYFGTGTLSAVLDNAPTYVNFLTIALSAEHFGTTPDQVRAFLATPQGIVDLSAVSLGAVFFGAMTYIGNAPNFMVRAIAESSGQRMPSFFGYVFRAVVILLPILVITWAIWIR